MVYQIWKPFIITYKGHTTWDYNKEGGQQTSPFICCPYACTFYEQYIIVHLKYVCNINIYNLQLYSLSSVKQIANAFLLEENMQIL